MSHYPNISDHGLIGDLQTAALVTTDETLHGSAAPDRDDYVSRSSTFRIPRSWSPGS